MATNDKTSRSESSAGVDVSVGGQGSSAIIMDEVTRTGRPAIRSHDGSGVKAEIGKDFVDVETRGGPQTDEEAGEEDLEDNLDGDEGEGSEGEEDAGDGEDLGEFDPANAESVEKFEAAYLTETGGPNLQKLMGEFDKNEQAGGEGGLNEGTYKFLEDRFGLTRDEIKDIEAGQKAKRDAQTTSYNVAVDEAGGGRDRVLKMVEWGKGGGYTAAQRARFSEAMKSGDPERAAEAVALLATRYEKATGDRPASSRRGVSPARDVAAAGGKKGGAAEPFKNHAEYRIAFKEARTSNDPVKLDSVRKRLKASPFYRSK